MYRRNHNPLIERPMAFHSFARWFPPWLESQWIGKSVIKHSAIVEKIGSKTMDAILSLQEEAMQLARVTW